MTLGAVLLFGLFAVAGWAGTDWLTDDPAGEDTVTMLRYSLVPESDDLEETLEWIGQEQDQTAAAMSDEAEPEIESGDPAAGGHSMRIAEISDVPGFEDADSESTSEDTEEPSTAEEAIPADVLADAPYLRGRVDLTDVVIADPVGSLDIDICAGPTRLPETPAGCPSGFGGTIVPFGGHLPPPDSPSVGGRPPTGFTAFGTDTLYVRAFRRSSVEESIWVAAVEWSDEWARPEEGCDLGDGVPGVGGVSYRFPVATIPIDTTTDPSNWPYDPDFDTLDVFAFGLTEGTDYAICTHWVDTSGVEGVVSFWESTRVVTASARRMTVSLLVFDSVPLIPEVDPLEPIDFLEVRTGCGRRETFEWPSDARYVRQDPPFTLCEVTGVSAVLQNGGIPVSMHLASYDSATYIGQSYVWLDIDRSDIFCRTDCIDRFFASFALPDIEHELFDPGGRFAIPPPFYRAGRLTLLVEFDSPPEPRHGWLLGEPQSFDTSDRVVEPPPVLTRVRMGSRRSDDRPYAYGDASFATGRIFTIENDVPVSVQVELLDGDFFFTPRPDREPCTPGGGAVPTYESTAPATLHVFALEGLCLGAYYVLRVTAVDEAGTAYDVRESPRDRANFLWFDTVQRTGSTLFTPVYTYDLTAELILGIQTERDCYRLGDLELRYVAGAAPVAGVAPIDNSRANLTAIREWDAARWGQRAPQPRYVFHFSSSVPSPPVTFRIAGAEAREEQNWISISIRFGRPDPWCEWGTDFSEDVSLSANPTLTELLAGVMITNGSDDYPTLFLRADPLWFVP